MQKVLVDANVLLSRTQRDWLFKLNCRLSGMFSIAVTEDILAETTYHFRRQNTSASGGQVANLVNKFRNFADEIITEYDCNQPYSGSDPNDRHVHAAARDGGCDRLLTADKAFAAMAASNTLPYSVYEADAFFLLIDDSSPKGVLEVTEDMLRYWRNRNEDPRLAANLRSVNCVEFADRVELHTLTLAGIPPFSPERTRYTKALSAGRPNDASN